MVEEEENEEVTMMADTQAEATMMANIHIKNLKIISFLTLKEKEEEELMTTIIIHFISSQSQ